MSKNYFINTENTTYAIGVDDKGIVRHLYWGSRIDDESLEIPDIWDTNSNHSDMLYLKDFLGLRKIQYRFYRVSVKIILQTVLSEYM